MQSIPACRQAITRHSYHVFAPAYAQSWGERWQPARLQADFLDNVARGARLLDVGCGSGQILRYCLAQGYDAYGLDIVPGMLAEAARIVPPARLLQADIRQLPYAAHSFDALHARYVLQHADDWPAVLQEWHRVLRPGGCASVAVHASPDETEHDYWFAFPQHQGRVWMWLRPVAEIRRQFRAAGWALMAQSCTKITAQMHNWHFLLRR